MTDITQRPKHKKLEIILLIVLPIAAFIVVGFVVYSIKSIPTSQSTNETLVGDPVLSEAIKVKNDRRAATKQLVVEKGYEAGQEQLDTQLNEAKDNQQKAALYLDKASLAVAQPVDAIDYAQALEYAYQSEALDPTYESAALIAQIEDYALSNIVIAIKYYHLVLERSTPEIKDLNPGDYEAIQARLTELEA